MDNEIVSGQQAAWSLLKKLGEGDAGEVYQVESLSGGQPAILKRPTRSAFAGEIYRQASQIRTEAKIIKALSAAFQQDPARLVGVPAFLDQSKPGADFQERYFIVIERAPGLDLGFLGRVTQLGVSSQDDLDGLSSDERAFVNFIAASRRIPARTLMTILHRLMGLVDEIHSLRVTEDGTDAWGMVWNDVKPDHLFWDVKRSFLTVIDWGNAHFLDADRTTSNRQFSWADDYRQLFEEMGRFLSIAAPDLSARLDWPGQLSVENASPAGIAALKERLEAALQQEEDGCAETRAEEEHLLQAGAGGEAPLAEIEAVQARILNYGELPDFAGALRYASSYAVRLTTEDRLDDLRGVCDWVAGLPGADPSQWRLICDLAQIPGRSEGQQRQLFLDGIQAAICQDWETLLWKILAAIQGYPEPDWWQDITALVRRSALGPDGEAPRPFVAVSRFTFALQAAIRRMEDHPSRPGERPSDPHSPLGRAQSLVRRMKEDVLGGWPQLDPDPPDCGLSYDGIRRVLAEARELLPNELRTLQNVLASSERQAGLVLSAWAQGDFLHAGQGLRCLLLWDPDRRRVLAADRAVSAAPEYLNKVHLGPQPGDNFPEWITTLEFRGRELRNQVGPAPWLDAILESCKQIRKGVWPSDLFKKNPAVLHEMPWLRKFERIELVPAEPASDQPAQGALLAAAPFEMHGVAPGPLGAEGAVALVEPLDTWAPEAKGSSARVLLGFLQGLNDQRIEAAVKLMRMDKVSYSLPLFREEIRVLDQMRGVPGVTRLLECGFMILDEGSQLPLDAAAPDTPAAGRVVRIGPDSTPEFLDRIEEKIKEGWIPYLALEKEKQDDSLLLLCDSGVRRGQYLPLVTLLQMSIQICDILQAAHERNVVYRDHKILHYYWRPEANGIYVIDWNVARYHPQGLTETDIHMDLVQFGARGLHHILTGRTAPGALPLGPTRPEEIERAAQSYQAQWTYDDQRLSSGLRTILERVLGGEYRRAVELGDDLKRAMMLLPNARL
jgi:serine/threonine protein kinase